MEFDRSQLPLIKREERPSKRWRFWFNLGLATSIILAGVVFVESPGLFNNILQATILGTAWCLAAMWVWYFRDEVLTGSKCYKLLWLILVCAGTTSDRQLTPPWDLILSGWALLIGMAMVIYVFASCWPKALYVTSKALAYYFCGCGLLTAVIGIACYVNPCTGATFKVMSREYAAEGVNALYATLIGTVPCVLGVLLLKFAKRIAAKMAP